MKRAFAAGIGSFVLGGVLWAAPITPIADKEKIAVLVKQLGSNSFRERESATRDLEALGEPALDSLREAAKSTDPEVVTRASKLVERIGVKVRTAKLLSPTVVDLDLKNVTVKEALAELSKQSGYDVVSPTGKIDERRITLQTGRVPFMRALELVCRKADLVEEPAASFVRPPTGLPPVGRQPIAPILRRPIQIQPLPAPILIQPIQVEERAQPPLPVPPKAIEAPKAEAPKPAVAPRLEVPRQLAQPVLPPVAPVAPPVAPRMPFGIAPIPARPTIVLRDGKADTVPTHVEGPVRISIRTESAISLTGGPVNPRTAADGPLSYIVVEVEPKFPIVEITGVTIRKAIDDQNRNLSQLTVPASGAPVTDTDVVANVRAMQLRNLEARVRVQRPVGGARVWPLVFRKTETPFDSLTEVSGTVAVTVRMPTSNLVEIDLDETGKGKGEQKGGGSVEVLGLRKNADGSYTLDVSTSGPVQANNPLVGNIVVQGRVQMVIGRNGGIDSQSDDGIRLTNKKGVELKSTGIESSNISFDGINTTSRTTMVFKPTEGFGEPVRMIRTGSTVERIEVPFSLKNVPLK